MKILACIFTGGCTREEGGTGCNTCPDYYPKEGVLMGQEIFCYKCQFDGDTRENRVECYSCRNHSNFKPTPAARAEVTRILKNLE